MACDTMEALSLRAEPRNNVRGLRLETGPINDSTDVWDCLRETPMSASHANSTYTRAFGLRRPQYVRPIGLPADAFEAAVLQDRSCMFFSCTAVTAVELPSCGRRR